MIEIDVEIKIEMREREIYLRQWLKAWTLEPDFLVLNLYSVMI